MDRRFQLKYILYHAIDVILISSSFYGVSTTISQILFAFSLPEIINLPIFIFILLYAAILSFFLAAVQLGVGFAAFFQNKLPPFLILVYFQFDQKELPDPLLDPLKSKIGILVLVVLIIGGYIAWPLYTIYGFYVLSSQFLAISVYSPEAIIIFIEGLAIAMGIPLIGLFFFILIGLLAIENRQHSP